MVSYRRSGGTHPAAPAVPVYRHFLIGGLDQLRLSARMVCGLWALATAVVPLGAGLRARTAPEILVATAAAAIISTVTAALVARWLGRRTALAAAAIVIAGLAVGAGVSGDRFEPLGAAAAVAAIAVFAFAELPSRLPAAPRKWAPAGFYACAVLAGLFAGSGSFALIAMVCLGALAGCQKSSGLRFFTEPLGLAALAAGTIVWAAAVGWSDGWAFSQWFGPLGVSPADWFHALGQFDPAAIGFGSLAIAATLGVAGLVRAGHAFGGYGSFLASWLTGPLVLAVCGAIPRSLAVAAIVPALSAVAAPGVVEILRCARSLSRRQRSAAKAGLAASRRILGCGSEKTP